MRGYEVNARAPRRCLSPFSPGIYNFAPIYTPQERRTISQMDLFLFGAAQCGDGVFVAGNSPHLSRMLTTCESHVEFFIGGNYC